MGAVNNNPVPNSAEDLFLVFLYELWRNKEFRTPEPNPDLFPEALKAYQENPIFHSIVRVSRQLTKQMEAESN